MCIRDRHGSKQEAWQYISGFKRFDQKLYQAESLICDEVFKKVNLNNSLQPKPNKNFVDCLARHLPNELLKDKQGISTLRDKAAYHLIRVKLKKNPSKLSTANAIEYMAKRKKKSKKHYRFVVFDRPAKNKKIKGKNYASSGSGQFIGEWVKTKNRNKDCQSGFPDQHYQDNEIFPTNW